MNPLVPKFNEFYASLEEQKNPRALLYINYGPNETDVDDDLLGAIKAIANWMPAIGRKCTVLVPAGKDYAVEVPSIYWSEGVTDVLERAKFKPNGNSLIAEGDLESVKFPINYGDPTPWFISNWKMIKKNVADMKTDQNYSVGHFSGQLENKDNLILDHVEWTDGAKTILTIFGWRVYKKEKAN